MANSYAHNTIRIKESSKGKDLIILVNSVSTHNFINVSVIKSIKAVIVKSTILAIIMANKNVMLYDAQSPKFTWFIQDYESKADLRILKPGMCDVVLGVDCSPILFYFIKMKISFRKEGRMIELRGIIEEAQI